MSKAKRLALCGLLLWCFAGSMMAQNDPLYVIKKGDHYLAHVGSGSSYTLQDATTFSLNCLWYSGPNIKHNYYFIDDAGNYRYLMAPLELGGTLYLSATHPGTMILNNTSDDYYFYDWDHGVARGVRHYPGPGESCPDEYNIPSNVSQCWEVVWVSYENNTWKMSSTYGYEIIEDIAALYQGVTVTEHGVQVTSGEGGIPDIEDFAIDYTENPLATHALDGTADPFSCTYIPAYTTYVFEGNTHNYFNGGDQGTNTPGSSSFQNATPSYAWTLTGEGAEYLTLSANDIPNPTLTYQTQNTSSSHKLATLTLTATYQNGVTQVRTATVTVKTECQNPVQASAPVATYDDVTVSWLPSANSYKVEWKEADATDWNTPVELGNVTSYTFTDLEYGTTYQYRVTAKCGNEYLNPPTTPYTFTTLAEPGLFIYGAVYGGGRMADVNGAPEVLVINCDSVSAIFGGNDIAGTVNGTGTITLGINASNDPESDAKKYNNGNGSTKVRVFDVYGGGNGYYAYGSQTFESATEATVTVPADASVYTLSQSNEWNKPVWTNPSHTASVDLTIPSIVRTSITMTNDQVRVDSLFGGAKNAFLTANNDNGSSIVINGGTAYAVFGGNNVGGGQGYGLHYIKVANTTTHLAGNIVNTATTGYGRNFGIRYLFGGGNKVAGSTTNILIEGGQMDTIFAGGNSASVYAANLTVNCEIDEEGPANTFGSVYSNAISSYSTENGIKIKDDYDWDGYTGIYNVRVLFGGNNRAMMTCLPNLTLSSGSIGTVYGGGNAGDMMAQTSGGSITFTGVTGIDDYSFTYSTKVLMNSPTILMDYLYGGCQMSNVGYSTWVQLQDGHVGTVYGGCNISGDVGSTRVHQNAPTHINEQPNPEYQLVYGATYVEASGGIVYKNLFAGSNGFYHCKDSYGIHYAGDINYDPRHSYLGMMVPTHNETHVILRDGATVNGNVYAGGNLACVGFQDVFISHSPYQYPQFVGLASLRMSGGTVQGNVFGGGNMASIYGSNEVRVWGGNIGGALYGGNDRLGKAGQITNRVLPQIYDVASDGYTSLTSPRVSTYVGVSGNPHINTVYGGGNGAYTYTGPGADMQYCSTTDLPIQKDIFVDIGIDGGNGDNGSGYIANVYGGGNGVSVDGFIKVFLNVKNVGAEDGDHVGNIFGGNNMGSLSVLSDIILLNGNVHNVYGGCDQGAMEGDLTVGSYNHVSSFVQLRDSYTAGDHTAYPTASVTGAVYGGCRNNGVTHNTLVLVERGDHSNADIYGGSDVSGTVGGNSQVVVTGGTVGRVFGGGKGVDTSISGDVVVDIDGATATVTQDVYGGSALGSVNTSASNTTTVNILNGTVNGNVYGGGLGYAPLNANGYINTSSTEPTVEAIVNGTVHVNIGSATPQMSSAVNIGGSVFGCNNLAGSPKGNVYVDVYHTAHNSTNAYPSSLTLPVPSSYFDIDTRYAINAVYGGGNLAAYVPTVNGALSRVYIHNCDNTIHYVYGGGNAADVPTTNVTIDGGLIGYVFGGGNGYGQGNPGANVAGGSTLALNGGVMGYVFGGSNANGMVQGATNLQFAETPTCSPRSINELYGGGNEADCEAITLNIPCGTKGVKAIYGGSRNADIGTEEAPANITLNINGGDGIDEVYGGNNVGGTIYGNVTLNLYGGIIDKAYGGNNAGGDINGLIQVNVEDAGDDDCPLKVNTVYGGGNMAAYSPTSTSTPTPEVNIKHGTINNAVYGGGKGSDATITADPKVTIGDNNASHTAIVGALLNGSTTIQGDGNVYGGGDAAAVDGNTTVIYQDTHANSHVNRLFGGGNEAGVVDATVNMNSGKVVAGIYGGCNSAGTVSGDIEVNISGGVFGTDTEPMVEGIFGGGYGNSTNTTGDVTLNVGDATHAPDIYADVYGGSALGKVNTQNTTTDKTTVNFAKGNLHGNLYGGGLGQASPPIPAEVYGSVEVNIGKDKNGTTVSGSRIYGSVFGANNVKGSPEGGVTVNVYSATLDSIFGGGNQANYIPTVTTSNYPTVNIYDGTINHKVVGGGNAANIGSTTYPTNPEVNISGGTICTTTTKSGIYGGCNTSGTVNGDITVNITGQATIGSEAIVFDSEKPVNVHGGGYGQGTSTTGDVTVNFGEIIIDDTGSEPVEVHTDYPVLYGDIYGGSALGDVNGSASDKTTVNILNGTIISVTKTVPIPGTDQTNTYYYSGNIFGGGLGKKAEGGHAAIPASVNGQVYVNIGRSDTPPSSDLKGKATLIGCNVYGCNNTYGSPQDDVFVNVYQTDHIEGTNTVDDEGYAILRAFGGGNEAHYAPENGDVNSDKKAHMYIHGCYNTIKYVYGGGNAADAVGVITLIGGGHFDEVYGGGNGLVTPANIGLGGIGINALAGHVNFLYEGSNKQGSNAGSTNNPLPVPPTGFIDCGDLFVDAFFFGDNEAVHYGDLVNSIDCSQASRFHYKYVYAGSRWAVVYGDIKLTVQGGEIENLFGGSKGYLSDNISADVRKFPTQQEVTANPSAYPTEMLTFLANNTQYYGKGGNIELTINGGTIGEVFGGCDELGNVEGKITVTVNDLGDTDCPLFVGNVYGASNKTNYTPTDIRYVPTNANALPTPEVRILKGNIGGTAIFDGTDKTYEGNIFGGGNEGNVTCNPIVIIGEKTNTNQVTIEGNVFGGGNEGDVNGSPTVIIVPTE